MGIFDYVRLSEDLRKRLGKYGEREYQTKYIVEDGYIRVYDGFTERRPAWESLVWVELLVEPGPGAAFMEPLMRTVDIGEIGEVRGAYIMAEVRARLYDGGVGDVLKAMGFEGPEEGEATTYERVRTELGRITVVGDEAVLRIERVRAENEPLGIRVVLRIRSGEAELAVPASVKLEVGGREITAVEEGLVDVRLKKLIWKRSRSIRGIRIAESVEVVMDRIPAPPFDLRLVAEAEAGIEEASEELINEIRESVEGVARKILCPTQAA